MPTQKQLKTTQKVGGKAPVTSAKAPAKTQGGKAPTTQAKSQAKTSSKVGGGPPHNLRNVNLPEVRVPYTKQINMRLNQIESTQRSLGEFYAELASDIKENFTEITAIKGLDLQERLNKLEETVSDHNGKITINHSFDTRIKDLEGAQTSRTSTFKAYNPNNRTGLFSPNGKYAVGSSFNGTQVSANMNMPNKGGARRTTKKRPVTKGGSK